MIFPQEAPVFPVFLKDCRKAIRNGPFPVLDKYLFREYGKNSFSGKISKSAKEPS